MKFGVKLKLRKSTICSDMVIWAGNEVSSKGWRRVKQDNASLERIETPKTAADLQQFLARLNWFRMMIPDLAKRSEGLQALLSQHIKESKSMKKKALAKRILTWNNSLQEEFDGLRRSLIT